MIDDEKADLIAALVAAKLSNRQIAIAAGCSRDTVARIRSHRRTGPRITPPDPKAKPVRCAHCGAVVYPPCLLQQLEALARKVVSAQ